MTEQETKQIRKAIKVHTCTLCSGTVNKGDLYYRQTYPIMHGCSPAKSPDDVWCPACIVKIEKLDAEHTAKRAERLNG